MLEMLRILDPDDIPARMLREISGRRVQLPAIEARDRLAGLRGAA